ncbi:protein PHOX1-like [Cynara cardunculus var. scolymus]|uniref:Phox/Bem1p n=1 Tax=Cynara cardunculus var. scolymus TaxID=59895 RepID=A0A124SEM1_CYNCS|nr:protein PHOX1-like [Cynara cardunculus var. scolymus]KVI00511.1 Phox/Bem1p [Cynara cardunculus var. scolymus]
MGKKSGKNKTHGGSKPADSSSQKAYDNDTIIFISMAQEHKDEGNKLFQKKDYEGSILKYQKALLLLPGNHIDVSYLHSSIAACYMQMGISDFPKAIQECNLALEVTPKYSKALLKRARCYEALNMLDLALRDVSLVLDMEPKNLMAMEIADRVKALMEKKLTEEGPKSFMVTENGGRLSEEESKAIRFPNYVEDTHKKSMKEKTRKKKSKKLEQIDEKKDEGDNKGKFEKISDGNCPKKFEEKAEHKKEECKKIHDVEPVDEDKLVVEEKISSFSKEDEQKRSIKLVYGDDIRWAKIPFNCDVLELREVIFDRFPVSRAVLMKYQDQEGDMVTVTTNEELRWAESTSGQNGSVKLYIVEVNPEEDPFFAHIRRQEQKRKLLNSSTCIDDWILEFAQLFKNHVGFDSDAYLDLHEAGMKIYTEAMEDTVTSEEAQELFSNASDKFQEMAALALFNCGKVHMSRARKRVFFTEDSSQESILSHIKDLYKWAQIEYSKAGERYEEALKVKPDFYEGFLALGHQQFEQAKLSWYYAIGTNVDLEKWDSTDVIQLYNKAEDNMERGIQMWEETEKECTDENSTPNKVKILQKTGTRKDEAEEQAAYMRSLINVLWGTMLYERSSMEYKLGLPFWHECLEIAVEKFELAGVSHTDMAVMIKNHCSNNAAPEGLGFDIDEIVQAWHEMYEVKRRQSGIPSFRLEPLLRRRVSKLFYALEHAR